MPIEVVFGAARSALAPQSGKIKVAAPCLRRGSNALICPGRVTTLAASPNHFVAQSNRWTCTAYSIPISDDLEQRTRETYRRLFGEHPREHPVRIWNFVPRINEHSRSLENYQAFCLGRHRAFREAFGEQAIKVFCAASAVGVDDDVLTVIGLSTRQPVIHLENPLQSPAYRYPDRYGPRPPSFSRASIIPGQSPAVFISGTAAVRRSESQGNTLDEQLKVTGENLDTIVGECIRHLGTAAVGLGRGQCWVYLRNESDLSALNNWLAIHAWSAPENITVLRSDICRKELRVEIELSWAKVDAEE